MTGVMSQKMGVAVFVPLTFVPLLLGIPAWFLPGAGSSLPAVYVILRV